MFTRMLSFVFAVVVAAVLSPALAHAQTEWTPYISGFGGGSMVPAFNIAVADPATASSFDVQGRKIVNTAAWGGSFGVWRRLDGRRLQWGLRGDVLHQKVDSDPQMLRVNGTLAGRPYDGVLPFPSADGQVMFVTGAFLVGWQLGSPATASGRLMPYVGLAGGIDHTTGEIGTSEISDTGGALHAVGGISIDLGPRASVFAEYRFGRVAQNIVLGTQNNVFSVNPNHVVAGFTLMLR